MIVNGSDLPEQLQCPNPHCRAQTETVMIRIVRARETESEVTLCRFVRHRNKHHNIRRPRSTPFRTRRPTLSLRATPTPTSLTVNRCPTTVNRPSLVNFPRRRREAGLQAILVSLYHIRMECLLRQTTTPRILACRHHHLLTAGLIWATISQQAVTGLACYLRWLQALRMTHQGCTCQTVSPTDRACLLTPTRLDMPFHLSLAMTR